MKEKSRLVINFDANQWASLNDLLELRTRLITRSKTKRVLKESIGLILDILVNKLQIYLTRLLCIVWAISEAIGGMFLHFQFFKKLDILRFSFIYDRSSNSWRRERTTYLKWGHKLLYEFCYLFPYDLWPTYLARIPFL